MPPAPDRWLLAAAASALLVFLCVKPVTAAFRHLTPRERAMYAVALLASIASALLIAAALAPPLLVRRHGRRDARRWRWHSPRSPIWNCIAWPGSA